MTDPEFQTFFDTVYHGIPDYAKCSIQEYLATGVTSEILLSDDAANKAEQKTGIAIPAATMVATDTNWHFVFRPFLKDAPPDKLHSIIQHEIIHAFLISVELHPNEPALRHVHEYQQLLEALRKKFDVKLPDGYDITEDLVCYVNDAWGADDLGAKEWLQEKLGLENVAI